MSRQQTAPVLKAARSIHARAPGVSPGAACPLRIAVLSGGDSAERTVSLKSGSAVAKALVEAGHDVETFDPALVPVAEIPWFRFDVAFLALHGGAGEDGRLQAELERLGVAYTGSGPATARLAMSKSASKERFLQHGVPTPPYVLLHANETLEHVVAKSESLGLPLVIKPDSQGSSLGVSHVTRADQMAGAAREAARFDSFIIAERAIVGRELTVAVIDDQSLPVLEITAAEGLFDYQAKYHDGRTQYRFDHGLAPHIVRHVERVARDAANGLGTRGLVRVDVMLDEQQQPWVLEVNVTPGMTATSLVPKAAARAGLGLPALCHALVESVALVEAIQ